uniref:RING-type E3 ubiquitin transferase n=1 Tax=Araucaria cunninghamii TaxID=56994 RepID=A0A0D6R8N3_ARACU
MHQNKVEMWLPEDFRCPISLDVMKDPVIVSSGITFDRHSIESWLDAGNIICPVTRQVLCHTHDLIPNHTLRRHIQQWCVANREMGGIERIPTPKAPLTCAQIGDILVMISAPQSCREGLRMLRAAAMESDGNRKRIASTNAATVVASAFCAHAATATDKSRASSVDVCEDALATLATTGHLDSEARAILLSSPPALASLTSFLVHGNSEGKTNAALMLQELTADRQHREELEAADGMEQGLVELVKEGPSVTGTKAAITTMYYVARDKSIRIKLVKASAIPLLLEILPESDKFICERSLAAVDLLCNCVEGRSAAYGHALTIPVIVKKILRVSNLATEFAVSILWTMCCHSSTGSAMIDALQSGAFQKLLVLIQLGCSEKTRKRATQLLKLFSHYTHEWECIETMDFKEAKRSL